MVAELPRDAGRATAAAELADGRHDYRLHLVRVDVIGALQRRGEQRLAADCVETELRHDAPRAGRWIIIARGAGRVGVAYVLPLLRAGGRPGSTVAVGRLVDRSAVDIGDQL